MMIIFVVMTAIMAVLITIKNGLKFSLLYNTACDTVFSITFNAANFFLLHVSKIEELLCCVCVTTTTSTKPTGST